MLGTGEQIRNPRTGASYSVYNAAPSFTPMPFMLLSRWLPGHAVERDQFAFSLAGPFFGALLGALLFLAYGWLGIGRRASLIFTGIFCLATLWWPASTTVFDQNQHAVLLLAAVLLAWLSGRRRQVGLAGLAGLIGGLLINYQEMYALVLPAVGLAVLAAPEEGASGDAARPRKTVERTAVLRYLAFGLGCCVGLGCFLVFNEIRWDTPLLLTRYGGLGTARVPTWGNPLAGFLGLAVSPGKGLIWFSPPLLLAFLGARALCRRAPALAAAVAGVSIIHLLIVTHLTFYGGDWCWGPRYTVPLMPLWALAFPLATLPARPHRLLCPLAIAGLCSQLMGVSLDQHRFFYERNIAPDFWASQPWFYFHESQLAARPFEILESVRVGPPAGAAYFNCSPTGQFTYCPFGSGQPGQTRLWMRHFQIFYLPRPWWGWMYRVAPEQRPVNPTSFLLACAILLAAGAALVFKSLTSGASAHSAVAACRVPAQAPWPTRLDVAVECASDD